MWVWCILFDFEGSVCTSRRPSNVPLSIYKLKVKLLSDATKSAERHLYIPSGWLARIVVGCDVDVTKGGIRLIYAQNYIQVPRVVVVMAMDVY